MILWMSGFCLSNSGSRKRRWISPTPAQGACPGPSTRTNQPNTVNTVNTAVDNVVQLPPPVWWRTHLDLVAALVRGAQSKRSEASAVLGDGPFDGFAQVVPEMPPVRDLHDLRGAGAVPSAKNADLSRHSGSPRGWRTRPRRPQVGQPPRPYGAPSRPRSPQIVSLAAAGEAWTLSAVNASAPARSVFLMSAARRSSVVNSVPAVDRWSRNTA